MSHTKLINFPDGQPNQAAHSKRNGRAPAIRFKKNTHKSKSNNRQIQDFESFGKIDAGTKELSLDSPPSNWQRLRKKYSDNHNLKHSKRDIRSDVDIWIEQVNQRANYLAEFATHQDEEQDVLQDDWENSPINYSSEAKSNNILKGTVFEGLICDDSEYLDQEINTGSTESLAKKIINNWIIHENEATEIKKMALDRGPKAITIKDVTTVREGKVPMYGSARSKSLEGSSTISRNESRRSSSVKFRTDDKTKLRENRGRDKITRQSSNNSLGTSAKSKAHKKSNDKECKPFKIRDMNRPNERNEYTSNSSSASESSLHSLYSWNLPNYSDDKAKTVSLKNMVQIDKNKLKKTAIAKAVQKLKALKFTIEKELVELHYLSWKRLVLTQKSRMEKISKFIDVRVQERKSISLRLFFNRWRNKWSQRVEELHHLACWNLKVRIYSKWRNFALEKCRERKQLSLIQAARHMKVLSERSYGHRRKVLIKRCFCAWTKYVRVTTLHKKGMPDSCEKKMENFLDVVRFKNKKVKPVIQQKKNTNQTGYGDKSNHINIADKSRRRTESIRKKSKLILEQKQVIDSKQQQKLEVRTPLPSQVPDAPAFVKSMSDRANDRKYRREILKATYKMQAQERSLMAIEDEYAGKLRSYRQKQIERQEKKEKRIREEKKRIVQQEKQLMIKLYQQRAILWYRGLKPWKQFVHLSKMTKSKALLMNVNNILKKYLSNWKTYSKAVKARRAQIENQKMQKANSYYRKKVLRLGWKIISKKHVEMKARGITIVKRARHNLLLRTFTHIQACLLLKQRFRQRIETRGNWYTKRRYLEFWKEFMLNRKEELLINTKKQETWSKVRTWLKDL